MKAQDNIPYYGKIGKADLEMRDCSFDPGNEAVILLDIGEIEFNYLQNKGWVSKSSYRIRIKILRDRAVEGIIIKIDSLSVRNEDEELQPFKQMVEFHGNMQKGDGYFLLTYNLFSSLDKNPFIEQDR